MVEVYPQKNDRFAQRQLVILEEPESFLRVRLHVLKDELQI